MKLFPILSLLALLALGFSCEDEITLDSRFGEPELVVEAWLNDQPEDQTILLTESQDYYDSRLPTAVTDATVVVCEVIDSTPTNNCYLFGHTENGRYVWESQNGQTLGDLGVSYGLGIQRGEEQFGAISSMSRTAIIDSLSFQFEEEVIGIEEGIYAQIYARDQVGIGDAYLIRSTINDTLLLRPTEMNLAYDASVSPGTNADGITLIFPLRFSINKTDEDGAPLPLGPGEKVAVEITGLSQEAYLYLRIVNEQINNGQSGLFDLPVANAPGNIFNVNTEQTALGFFNVGRVVRIEGVSPE